MYLKAFRVKSNTQLRNSERKRLKVLLQKEFPKLQDSDVDELIPQGDPFFLIKLVTHGGHSVALYMVEKTPLMFEFDSVLYPSVYMLWKVPHILPALTMWPQLFDKIVNGADLMLPGVVVKGPLHPHSYGSFEQGDRIVINTTNNKAPMAIGRAALSSHDMYMAAQRGKAVKVLHTIGDKLWDFGMKTEIPNFGSSDGYEEEPISSSNRTETEDLTETESSRLDEESISTIFKSSVNSKLDGSLRSEILENDRTVTSELETETSIIEQTDIESSTESEGVLSEKLKSIKIAKTYNILEERSVEDSLVDEMDRLLEYCFLKALKFTTKKVELPLLTSTFYKLHMIPSCPLGSQVDIKKSSYKKLSKFLNAMEKKGIVKVKELTKGVENIVFIDHSHQMLKELVDLEPSQISKASSGDAKPMITELYTVTAAVLPVLSAFGLRKGDMITMPDLRKYITEYVKREKLQDPVEKSWVNVDDALQRIVQDPYTMAVTWEDLMGLFVSHMSHGYRMNLFGEKSISLRGKLEPIDIQIGRRTGNKKVTLINNLELYGINIQEFARECQHGVAASTSISTIPGKRSQQLLVQGNQVIYIGNLLTTKYQIPKRYIRGLENASRPKK